MTRRSVIALLAGALASACNELRRYHSSVRFELSNTSPSAGEAIEVSFMYLDEAEPGTWSVVLVNGATGAVVDRADVADSSTRATLTPREPGPHTVECRRHDRMVAHRVISVR